MYVPDGTYIGNTPVININTQMILIVWKVFMILWGLMEMDMNILWKALEKILAFRKTEIRATLHRNMITLNSLHKIHFVVSSGIRRSLSDQKRQSHDQNSNTPAIGSEPDYRQSLTSITNGSVVGTVHGGQQRRMEAGSDVTSVAVTLGGGCLQTPTHVWSITREASEGSIGEDIENATCTTNTDCDMGEASDLSGKNVPFKSSTASGFSV